MKKASAIRCCFRQSRIFAVLLAAASLALGGCKSTDPNAPTRIDDFDYTSIINNHLTMSDFFQHMIDCGIKIEQVQPVRADVLRAAQGAAVLIGKDEIGVYYFNTDIESQRKIIAQYHKDGFAYILGFRFPVFIAGSYVILGAEKHPQKKEIVAALRSFK